MNDIQFKELTQLLKSSLNLIPFNDQWKYDISDKRNEVIPAHKTRLFLSAEGKGWLIAAHINANDPNAELTVKLYSPQSPIPYSFAISPLDLYAAGWNSNAIWAAGTWVSVYSVPLATYAATLWHPSFFGYPYNNKVEVYVDNPTTGDITVSVKVIRLVLEGH